MAQDQRAKKSMDSELRLSYGKGHLKDEDAGFVDSLRLGMVQVKAVAVQAGKQGQRRESQDCRGMSFMIYPVFLVIHAEMVFTGHQFLLLLRQGHISQGVKREMVQ